MYILAGMGGQPKIRVGWLPKDDGHSPLGCLPPVAIRWRWKYQLFAHPRACTQETDVNRGAQRSARRLSGPSTATPCRGSRDTPAGSVRRVDCGGGKERPPQET